MAKRNRERRPARRTVSREVRKRILVVCEGRATEPDYLRGFQQWCRNPLLSVEIAGAGGDPSYVVKLAKQRKGEAQNEAKRLEDENLSFDEVWCLFDVDQHARLKEALNTARDNDIAVGVSNPCFELWLVLHFRESPGAQERAFVQAMMKDLVADYDKHLDFGKLERGYAEAVKRAQRIDADCGRMGEPGRNPSTGVYRLTELIRNFRNG
jgi:hypothetical protein